MAQALAIRDRHLPKSGTPTAAQASTLSDQNDPGEMMMDTDAAADRSGDDGSVVPEPVSGTGNRLRLELFTNVSAVLDGSDLEAPTPTICSRNDGPSLFYPEAVNAVFGDPGTGKTWLALAAAQEVLKIPGSRVLVADLDHNGVVSTLRRLLDLGVDAAVLKDPDRFLHVEPEDARHLSAVVDQMRWWKPTFAVVDSMGELLPMYGAKSNHADEFTNVNRAVLVKLARTGASVVYIDHMSKGLDSRNHGAGGTAAKKRAVDGSYIRATLKEQFIPGRGGSAYLSVVKDRHGGLSVHCAVSGAQEPVIGLFTLTQESDALVWDIRAPQEGERVPEDRRAGSDADAVSQCLAAIKLLDPPATSANDAQKRLKMNRGVVLAAWAKLREEAAQQDGQAA